MSNKAKVFTLLALGYALAIPILLFAGGKPSKETPADAVGASDAPTTNQISLAFC
jgi:hypothetical protein